MFNIPTVIIGFFLLIFSTLPNGHAVSDTEKLLELLEKALTSGKEVDPSKADLIFKVYDRGNKGYLALDDLVYFGLKKFVPYYIQKHPDQKSNEETMKKQLEKSYAGIFARADTNKDGEMELEELRADMAGKNNDKWKKENKNNNNNNGTSSS